ncbi:1,3-propanediol dehydrogenase [Labrenzia sp. THAF82]|uniref:iron-containing alcohol dehydrogenase n=1 Tax=Labrenzia sp. THAF82 TaxID=2587861 RepID=UPI001267D3AA|nr:iron-containing alcohol dehydrogenase [Labrenzia sp. THAF82]QFT33350.1 1,3-propanediol dehydrogenase [Labrenzia sp. THAF82]
MTLITYVTRVHFADGVLEEALWSEIEVNRKKRPLIITDEPHLNSELFERLLAGLPVRTSLEVFSDIPDIPNETAAKEIATVFRQTERDLLIAFGRNTAIDLAKIARISIAHTEPLETFSYASGGSRRIGTNLPDLYAVPSIQGFGAAVSAHAPVILTSGERTRLMCKKLVPTMTICDPTLTLGAGRIESASAGADAMGRCIEAYLSPGFNPPADGIALDGLGRVVSNLHKVLDEDTVQARRELMAASLNGALALQKGLGTIHAIGCALETVAGRRLDPGALSRLLLPAVLQFNADAAQEKYITLKQVLKSGEDRSPARCVADFLYTLPLPESLAEMGINEEEIRIAADLAASDLAAVQSPRALSSPSLFSIMKSALSNEIQVN